MCQKVPTLLIQQGETKCRRQVKRESIAGLSARAAACAARPPYHRTLQNAGVAGGWLKRRRDGGFPCGRAEAQSYKGMSQTNVKSRMYASKLPTERSPVVKRVMVAETNTDAADSFCAAPGGTGNSFGQVTINLRNKTPGSGQETRKPLQLQGFHTSARLFFR